MRLCRWLAAAVLLAICALAQAGGRADARADEPTGTEAGELLGERVIPEYRIVPRAYTHDDGLPQSGVNDIVQDREGYLWLGTFGGLARFDGSSFRSFRERSAPVAATRPGERRTGPASDRIVSLFEDDRGRLWVGTQDAGVSVYERGVFRHLPICGGSCQVADVAQSPDGSIWVATGDGVFRVDPGSTRAMRLAGPDRPGYNHIAIDRGGRVFVGGYGGLYRVTGNGLREIPRPAGDVSQVNLLESDGDGLLVGTAQRLYRYRHDDARWVPQEVAKPIYAVRDARDHWWVAQATREVVREQAPGEWRRVPELSGLGVTSLAGDDEGNLWVGTASKGLLRLREPLFGLLAASSLGSGDSGRAIVEDGRGGFWFGLACDALRHLDAEGRLRSWPVDAALGNDCISSLLQDPDGTLWIGTGSGVLGRLADGVVERVASWGDGNSIGIWLQEDGGLLVSAGASTYLVRPAEDGRPLERRRIWAVEGMRVNSAVPAARGGRWLVGDMGVVRLVGDQVVERWSPEQGLSSRFARALHEDRHGVLWIGTYGGGLNRIANGRVYRYGSDNGLSDEAVSCILADGRGRLWLGGNRGVTLLPVPEQAGETIESLAFAAHDGLTPSEINGGTSSACLRDARGRLWFSLVEGFAVLDPARVEHLRSTPLRAHIEDVSAAGARLEPADGVLPLASFTRNLQIRYTAINLSRPRETRFRFRLSGFDADWVEAGQNRTILYPSIPWGEHLFEVQARIAGGPWSPTASLRIAHPQPWYQRPWIWTLATSMGLVVLLGATRHERVRPQPTRRRRRGGSAEPERVEPERIASERDVPPPA